MYESVINKILENNLKAGGNFPGGKTKEFKISGIENPAPLFTEELVLPDHFDRHFSQSILVPGHNYGNLTLDNSHYNNQTNHDIKISKSLEESD